MKGGSAIRNQYCPYHPWRHGHRREKIKDLVVKLARILLILELIWLAFTGLSIRFTDESTFITESPAGDPEKKLSESGQELYGIGIEKGAKTLFWFHKEAEQKSGETSSP